MIRMHFDDGGLALDLANAPQVTGLQLQKWMTLFVARLQSAAQKNIGGGGFIGRRTGNLARALQRRVSNAGNTVVGEVWPDRSKAIYGDIQEQGGTILPRRGSYLAIPLSAMLTGNGVARGSAGDVRQNPGAYGFSGTFVRNSIIFGKVGRNSIVPIFVLKTSVTLPARRYLEQTLIQEMAWGAGKLEEITQESVSLIFEGKRA